VPWAADTERFVAHLRHALPGDRLLLAMVNGRPAHDHVLIADGCDPDRVGAWCEAGHRRDQIYAAAVADGRGVGVVPTNDGGLLPPGTHAMTLALRAGVAHDRAWVLVRARAEAAFTAADQRRGELLLRMIQAAFDHVPEVGMGRVLLGADHRVIHADPATESWFLDHPAGREAMTRLLPAVIAQRWPDVTDARPHDVALDLAGRPSWLRVRRLNPHVGRAAPKGWYVEVRGLAADDPPPVGLVEDDRIGRTMGRLADGFAAGMTLADAAEAEGVSPFHFHRLFSKQAGVSPKQFVLRSQLMIAKWRLRASRMPISEIAAETGFASHGHFTATFTRMVGLNPSVYRDRGR